MRFPASKNLFLNYKEATKHHIFPSQLPSSKTHKMVINKQSVVFRHSFRSHKEKIKVKWKSKFVNKWEIGYPGRKETHLDKQAAPLAPFVGDSKWKQPLPSHPLKAVWMERESRPSLWPWLYAELQRMPWHSRSLGISLKFGGSRTNPRIIQRPRSSPFQKWAGARSSKPGQTYLPGNILPGKFIWSPESVLPCADLILFNNLLMGHNPFLRTFVKIKEFWQCAQISDEHKLDIFMVTERKFQFYSTITALGEKSFDILWNLTKRKLRTQHPRREKGETHAIQKILLITHIPWQVKFPPPDLLLSKVLWQVKWQLHGSCPRHCHLVSTVLMLDPLSFGKNLIKIYVHLDLENRPEVGLHPKMSKSEKEGKNYCQ